MSVPSLERPDNDGHRPQLVISGHDDWITAIAYLPNGQVVTSSRDGLVKIWNVESGREEWKIAHWDWVDNLAVTSGGTKIISTECQSREVKVWDVASHKLVKAWTHRETHIRVAISPDDRLVAVGKRGVVFYTLEGKKVDYATNIEDVDGKLHYIQSMSFSPDGSKLACASSGDAFVYDVKSGDVILGYLNGSIRANGPVLWSSDGSRLFSTYDSAIHCWNSATGQQIGQPWTGHTNGIRSLSLSPNGLILASASLDKTVRLWNATAGDPIGHLQYDVERPHDSGLTKVCFAPNGECVASGGFGGKIYLWRLPWLDSVESGVIPLVMHVTQGGHSSVSILTDKLCSNWRATQHRELRVRNFATLWYKDLTRFSSFSPMSAPAPDLTSCIAKSNDQYIAGGGFGDVYRCWYINESRKEV